MDHTDGSPDASADPEASTGETPSIPPGVLELDTVYETLGHPRRRYLCYTLLEDREWTLREVARKVAAWEHDVSEDEVPNRESERAHVSLYHAHVPKLVDEGVVEFDATTETIRAGENAEQVLAALEGVGASVDADQERHAGREMDE